MIWQVFGVMLENMVLFHKNTMWFGFWIENAWQATLSISLSLSLSFFPIFQMKNNLSIKIKLNKLFGTTSVSIIYSCNWNWLQRMVRFRIAIGSEWSTKCFWKQLNKRNINLSFLCHYSSFLRLIRWIRNCLPYKLCVNHEILIVWTGRISMRKGVAWIERLSTHTRQPWKW